MCLGVSSVCRRFHYSEASFGVHPIHLSAKFTFIRGKGVSITVHDVKISFNASTANLFPFPWPLENSWPRFEGDGLESRRFERNLRREKCASRRRFILVCLLRERKRSSSCVFDENWIERGIDVSLFHSCLHLSLWFKKMYTWSLKNYRSKRNLSMKLLPREEKFKFLERSICLKRNTLWINSWFEEVSFFSFISLVWKIIVRSILLLEEKFKFLEGSISLKKNILWINSWFEEVSFFSFIFLVWKDVRIELERLSLH